MSLPELVAVPDAAARLTDPRFDAVLLVTSSLQTGLPAVDRALAAARVLDTRVGLDVSLLPAEVSGQRLVVAPTGPLSRDYPHEATVRFHLGVLLLWTGRIAEARRQFRLASRTQPGSPLAREALRYLDTIRTARS